MKFNWVIVIFILSIFVSCKKKETFKPKDFNNFWDEAVIELGTEINFDEIVKDSIVDGKKWNLYKVKSYEDIYIYTWVSEPLGTEKFPIKIRFSGMSKENRDFNNIRNDWFLKEKSTINMLVDIRGQGLSVDQIGYENFLINGLSDKETYIYKGAYLDAVRAVDFISLHPKSNGNIIVTGGSQGGSLSIVATALNPKVTMCSIGFPFLSDLANYDKKEWPMSVFMLFCKNNKEDYFELVSTLSYFDMLNFADKIKVPIFIRTQEIDRTTPLRGIMKFYNKINVENKDIYIEPCEGHGCSSKSEKANELESLFIKNNLIVI